MLTETNCELAISWRRSKRFELSQLDRLEVLAGQLRSQQFCPISLTELRATTLMAGNDAKRYAAAVIFGLGMSLLSGEQPLEVHDHLHQAVTEGGLRLPMQNRLCLADVWTSLLGVVLGKGTVNDSRRRTDQCNDRLREFANRKLFWIPEIKGPNDVIRGFHQSHEAIDKIIYVAERARLAAIAVDGDVLVLECLDDEI